TTPSTRTAPATARAAPPATSPSTPRARSPTPTPRPPSPPAATASKQPTTPPRTTPAPPPPAHPSPCSSAAPRPQPRSTTPAPPRRPTQNPAAACTDPLCSPAYHAPRVPPSSPTRPSSDLDSTFYSNGTCNGPGSPAGHVTLDAQGKVPNSNTKTTLAAGS